MRWSDFGVAEVRNRKKRKKIADCRRHTGVERGRKIEKQKVINLINHKILHLQFKLITIW